MKTKTQKEMAEYMVKWLIDNGWDIFGLDGLGYKEWVVDQVIHSFNPPIRLIIKTTLKFVGKPDKKINLYEYPISDILFNHEVAKKVFGEEDVCKVDGTPLIEYEELVCGKCGLGYEVDNCKIAWAYHLQQMATSDNPVKYAYEYLISKKDNNGL